MKKLNHHYLEKQIDGESGFELKSADWNQANELLVIPYTDDVHLRNLRTYELIVPYSEQFSDHMMNVETTKCSFTLTLI